MYSASWTTSMWSDSVRCDIEFQVSVVLSDDDLDQIELDDVCMYGSQAWLPIDPTSDLGLEILDFASDRISHDAELRHQLSMDIEEQIVSTLDDAAIEEALIERHHERTAP